MPRYIDAEAFEADYKARLCTGCNDNNGKMCRACWVMDVLNDIETAPTISPDEVRGVGKWEQNDNGTWSCSECHSWIPDEQHYYARFCLFCGAKMEVSEND